MNVEAVAESFVKTLPWMFVLAGLVAVGLLLTDGASWVTIVGALGGVPILIHAGWRELDRYHARHAPGD